MMQNVFEKKKSCVFIRQSFFQIEVRTSNLNRLQLHLIDQCRNESFHYNFAAVIQNLNLAHFKVS